ncbi:MAG: DUF2066 domain-containing protein [Rickettsiales bacterium]
MKISRYFIFTILILLHLIPKTSFAGETVINSEVSVYATGNSAESAKINAFKKGELDALTSLLEKLAPSDQIKNLVSSLDPKKINKMITNIQVLSEHSGGKSYQAQLLISFDGDELSKFIENIGKQTEYNENRINSFLIIPYYHEEKRDLLWESSNPWRNIWANVSLENNSGDIIVPYGDSKDNFSINTANIDSVEYKSLASLGIRYGVTDIVVVNATLTRKPDMLLSVIKRHISRKGSEITKLDYRADPQETRELFLSRAARDIVKGLQYKKIEKLSTAKTVIGGEKHEIMTLVSMSTIPSWTKLRKKLSELPMIDKIKVLAVSAKQIDTIIYYRGRPESLARAILASKIRLIRKDNYWIVSNE